MIDLVNWQQEEPTGYGGGRQLSLDGTSRVTGDSHARICERLGVKLPGATRRRPAMVVPTATVGQPVRGRPEHLAIIGTLFPRSFCADELEIAAGRMYKEVGNRSLGVHNEVERETAREEKVGFRQRCQRDGPISSERKHQLIA